ncbi:MAG: integrase domain-containing protein [Pseudomonadota bacterium]
MKTGSSTGGGWKTSLAAVLKAHNGAKQDGSVASHATQDKRADVLYAGFAELRQLGYRLDSVTSLRGKHVEALVSSWHGRGLSASTIQNNLSIFRTFSAWIGKTGMVEGVARYLGAGVASRTSIAREDRSWSAKGVDVAAKLAEVRSKDARVALQLELSLQFSLRPREAMQLRPTIADKGSYLAVTLGTKGGRDRVVPIDTAEKRALLERAKTLAAHRSASTSDPALKLHQWKNHYYHVVRSCGITRENGFTPHGLRHQYANDRYKAVSGAASPVRGGSAADRETDRAARLIVAEELGHSREDITTHYLGR